MKIKCKFPTDNIGQIILAVWIIFSVVFITNNIWQNFKTIQINEAAQAGYQQAVVDLVNQAESCQPFPINLGENSIELQKLNCQ
jgi:predicted negative regulator of RcsB-dependent stress response